MTAKDSFLSSPSYGYDYVLAVTQDSINATALHFLHSKQPVVNVCYVYDDNGDPKQVEYEAFKASAKGSDPFAIPDGADPDSPDVQNINNASFMFGFRAAMGLPDGFPASVLPDIVTLGPDANLGIDLTHVIYRLLCKQFLLVELKQPPHKKASFHSYAQPKGPSGTPWIFTFKVEIIAHEAKDAGEFIKSPAFGNLPDTVQQKLTSNPQDFSIRQLLFDFSNAGRESAPVISGVENAALLEKLNEDFGITYFKQMQAAGAPILAVTPASGPDPFTGLKTEFCVNPSHAGQRTLATLNYLCSTADHTLPPATQFTWDWVDPGTGGDFDGVCVINRNTLTQHLESNLAAYVDKNCYLPQPIKFYVDVIHESAGFGLVPRTHQWPDGKVPDPLKQDFKLTKPAEGTQLLQWTFTSSREDDESYWQHGGGDSWILVNTAFEMTVTVSGGNTLVIVQHVLVHFKAVVQMLDVTDKRMIDITITDTFTLAADASQVAAHRDSVKNDNSEDVPNDAAMPDFKRQCDVTKRNAMAQISASFVDIPLSLVSNVIFPGGRAFLFKEVSFSDHQDLVAHITYKDPR